MNILQLQKELFNPENYTEENNPFLSAIARELSNATDLGRNSNAMEKLLKKNSIYFDEFINSLDEHQKELYEQLYYANIEENSVAELESFVKGFKIATKIMTECLCINNK